MSLPPSRTSREYGERVTQKVIAFLENLSLIEETFCKRFFSLPVTKTFDISFPCFRELLFLLVASFLTMKTTHTEFHSSQKKAMNMKRRKLLSEKQETWLRCAAIVSVMAEEILRQKSHKKVLFEHWRWTMSLKKFVLMRFQENIRKLHWQQIGEQLRSESCWKPSI